jgi:hypothetical protein
MDKSKTNMKETSSLLQETVQQSTEVLQNQLKIIEREIKSLPKPEVYELNRRSTLQISAAVAVDAGQSLFGGILREMGIMLLQVASSEDIEPKTYVFAINPILKDVEKKKMIEEQLERLKDKDKIVKDFITEMGWDKITQEGVMPPECYVQISPFGSFIRELLEWTKLRETGIDLKEIHQKFPNIQPVLLRDGPLSFFNIKEHALGLSKIFKEIGIPLLGISKTSTLLRNPLIIMWLKHHKIFNKEGPFMIKLPAEKFKELGYSLSRYFGAYGEDPSMKFGTYIIVRFDPLPGSKNIFAVDVPHYYFNLEGPFDNLLVILSGVAEHSTATSYPIPGYPYALRKAHERVVFTRDKVYLLENTLRRSLPPDVYDMLKSLEI